MRSEQIRRAPAWAWILLLFGAIGNRTPPASAQTPPTTSSPPPLPSTRPPQATPDGTTRPAPANRPKPGPAPGLPQTGAAGGSQPKPAAETALEERLRRMEEMYLRMERSNRQIQAQYDALLRKYDDLSRQISNGGSPSPSRTRPVSRSAVNGPGASPLGGAPIAEPSPPLEAIEAEVTQEPDPTQGRAGAEGTGGRTRPTPPPAAAPLGAEGEIGRGTTGSEILPQPVLPEPTPESTMSRMDRIGGGAEGTGGRTALSQQPAALPPATRPAREEAAAAATGRDLKPKKHPGKIAFGEGLEFTSDDEEFKLQFHNLTQAEFRGFPNGDQGYLQSQFFIPRQRWYFVGDLTKNLGFYTVINRGYGALDLLDAFITFRFGNQLRIRLGRMKTPYLYEYFQIAEGDLIAPERSIYAGNMALNRQMGAMALGTLLDGRLDYQLGLFNGPRRSFQDFNSAKDIIGNITTRPWLKSERIPALNYLNLGGSWDVGYQDNFPPQPIFFETANDQTPNNATSLSPTFLHLNNNVREFGERVQWGAHVVWYYKSLFILAEYGGGRAGYALVNSTTSTPVNYSGYNVTVSYMVTGEELTRRVNVLKPRRDFNFDFLKGGAFSPGALELLARYSTMDFGRNIFTAGFADPNLWTNHVWATDIGFNWYLNFYTKIMFDWQHSEFGNPVSVAPSRFKSAIDLIWLRFQVFF